jgi:hypothetical protein
MAHWNTTHATVPAPVLRSQPAGPRALLYKADHPRAIDRHIDFFGDGTTLTEADSDGCGDLFLERLA